MPRCLLLPLRLSLALEVRLSLALEDLWLLRCILMQKGFGILVPSRELLLLVVVVELEPRLLLFLFRNPRVSCSAADDPLNPG